MSAENPIFVSEHFLYFAVSPAALPHVDVNDDEYRELYFPGITTQRKSRKG